MGSMGSKFWDNPKSNNDPLKSYRLCVCNCISYLYVFVKDYQGKQQLQRKYNMVEQFWQIAKTSEQLCTVTSRNRCLGPVDPASHARLLKKFRILHPAGWKLKEMMAMSESVWSTQRMCQPVFVWLQPCVRKIWILSWIFLPTLEAGYVGFARG